MTQSLREKQSSRSEPRVTLKTVADHLGLTPGTVSAAVFCTVLSLELTSLFIGAHPRATQFIANP